MKKSNVGSKLCMTGLSTALLMSSLSYNHANVAHAKDTNDNTSKKKAQQSQTSSTSKAVDDADLKSAVAEAKKAGVNVKQGNIQHHKVSGKNAKETQKKIQEDYQKQIDELKKATKKAKEDQDKYKKEVAAVKEYNDKQIKKYNDEVKKEKSTVDSGKKNPSKPKYGSNINGDKGKYYTKSGSWHNLKSKTIDNDIHVNATGTVKSFKDLQNGNFAIHAYSDKKGKLANDKIVQKVSWGNVKPKGKVVKGDKITEDMHKKVPGFNKPAYNTSGKNNPFGKTTQLYSVKAGQWVTIPNAVHLANGKKKDLKVKFQKSGTKLDYGSNWVTFWNEGGSINYYDGTHDLSHTPPKDKITANYKVGDGKDKYLWTGATFDIDGGQALTMEDNNYAIVALGGGLKVDSDKVKKVTSAKPLGKTWGKDKGSNLLNGTSSVPDGTAIFAKYDNVISHSVSNTGVKGSTLVANGDFGMHVNTSIAEYPKLKKEPKKPTPPKVQYNLQDMSITPTTKKSVSKKDVGYDKDYNYTLDYQLPVIKDNQDSKKTKDEQNTSKATNNENPKDEFNGKYENDYHTFTLGDDLPNELRIQKDKIKVTDDKGKDVTKEGDLKVDEKNQSFRWTPKKPSDFSSKKLKVTVASQVSSEADLKKWKKDNNTFEIPNTGYLELDGKTLPTNKVPVFVKKKVKSDIKKHILEDNQLKEHNKSDKGKDINYQLDYTLGNDKNYKKVSLKDDLEDVEDLKGVKVYLPKSQKDELSKKELSDIQKALKDAHTKQDQIQPDANDDKQDQSKDDKNENNKAKADGINIDLSSDNIEKAKKDKDGKIDLSSLLKIKDKDNDSLNKDLQVDDNIKYDSKHHVKPGTYEVNIKGKDIEKTVKLKVEDKGQIKLLPGADNQNDNTQKTSDKETKASDNRKTEKTSSKSEGERSNRNADSQVKEDDKNRGDKDEKATEGQTSNKGDMDITKLGDLKVDNKKESFVWTPKDTSILKGKKVKVLLNSKFKDNVDYKNFAKGDKYVIPNISQIDYDGKTENSNKVDTEIPKPKKPEAAVPPKKEDPKKPEPKQPAPQPQKPTPPQKAEKPKKEEPKKDLPMTGTEKSIAGIIIGSILIGVAGLSTYIYKRRQS
ncbi:LPXTG cell wall anchor domain-containing protein [Staphylococcus caprae]|uniref:LPXTG cell wall anchor domain-containing protein n=1 Tax=Staphylococcus caprae TaxID=29380 RepID=UPI000CD09EBC|nr:LPXTG cell wall anchor domain-containing protein [Staphylococcus caprae]POA06080.1 peptidase [Staphylococcus caprae]SUL89842.1 Uncharacterised protein [Staphylococcus caprae]